MASTPVGTIAATTWTLLRAATFNLQYATLGVPFAYGTLDLCALGIAAAATVLLVRKRAPNSTILIGAGALIGWVAQMLVGRL